MAGYGWLSKLVTVAILAGFSSVILVMLLGQSRVFYAMSQDGLVPKVFSDVHPRYKTPWKSQHHLFRPDRAVRRIHTGRCRGRDDEHRDALRVHAGVRGRLDHARPPAGHPARLRRSGASCRRRARHHHLRCDDLRPRLDELDAAGRMAGHRSCPVLRLRDRSTVSLENA